MKRGIKIAFLRCDLPSAALEMQTTIQVILPDDKLETAPVIYLLHGLTDNCTCWQRYTRVEQYAREKNAVVIMPEVQRSFYFNMQYGSQYFDYVTKELPMICQKYFRINNNSEKTYIMGLSMGGYGAMKSALTYPHNYAGCATFSGVLNFNEFVDLKKDNPAFTRDLPAILGLNKSLQPKDDLFYLTSNLKEGRYPKLFITCGIQDELVHMNHQMKQHLENNQIELHYEEWEGDHNWFFWDTSIKKAFDYFL